MTRPRSSRRSSSAMALRRWGRATRASRIWVMHSISLRPANNSAGVRRRILILHLYSRPRHHQPGAACLAAQEPADPARELRIATHLRLDRRLGDDRQAEPGSRERQFEEVTALRAEPPLELVVAGREVEARAPLGAEFLHRMRDDEAPRRAGFPKIPGIRDAQDRETRA